MPFSNNKNIITAIDFGNSKILAMVGIINENDTVSVIDHYKKDTGDCVRRGNIINPNLLSENLSEIFETLEKRNKYSYEELSYNIIIGISAPFPIMKFEEGEGRVTKPQKETVTLELMREVAENAAQGVPNDYEELTSVIKFWEVDKVHIENPYGLSYKELKAITMKTFMASNLQENISKIIESFIEDEVAGIVFNGMAVAPGVIKEINKTTNALVIDMGAGLTEVAYYKGGAPMYYDVIPVGCDNLANDLNLGLDISFQKANEILINSKYWTNYDDEFVDIKGLNNDLIKKIPITSVEIIVESRMKEIFNLIKKNLDENKFKYNDYDIKIIITGGGAKYQFTLNILKNIFPFADVKIGIPEATGAVSEVLDPRYSAAYGLLVSKKNIILEDRSVGKNYLKDFFKWFKGLLRSGNAGVRNSIKL